MDTFEGAVSARIPTFPDTGKPKGFAFIVFETAEAALEAYGKCQGQDFEGREMKVELAFDKGNRGRSPGGGNFGGGNWDSGGRGGRGGDRGFRDKRKSFVNWFSQKQKCKARF
ncbi:hypothetical protein ACJMK2_035698 [Sinanodonta woodiana]|uniref:RRM domain-containing protein n=1 Tax=Sinanodonta woodiana TaxID=1069815 RepID=A0ABD3WZQ9_SINWO